METIDRMHIAALTEAQQERFRNRTGSSAAAYTRARDVLPKGVASSFQANDPWPIFIARGDGSRVWDVDGNEYVDFHNGSGAMVIGHAHPEVRAAVKSQVDQGTHFAASGTLSTTVATELQRRFGLPKWCFSNSGTEAVNDAVRIARAATGREMILKFEGSYHGDSDAMMVSVYADLADLEATDLFSGIPYGAGIPKPVSDLTRAISYNDVAQLERAIGEAGDEIAALVMEPVITNYNIVPPRDGYLEKVRELTSAAGILLIFDEVKTGATVAPGGVSERLGVGADMVALAKAVCGGYPGGCLGITCELADVIESGAVSHYGTFNGNPLSMTAAEVTLTKVLTDDAYDELERVNRFLMAACQEVIDTYDLPAYTEGIGAKGSVIFSSERLFDYRDYLTKVDVELSRLAWFYMLNEGVLISPGTETDWTLSTAHGEDEAERYVAAFSKFAKAIKEG